MTPLVARLYQMLDAMLITDAILPLKRLETAAQIAIAHPLLLALSMFAWEPRAGFKMAAAFPEHARTS